MRQIYIILLVGFSYLSFAQNQNISNGNFFDGEPYLAVNPNDSRHLVVSWMGAQGLKIAIKSKVSFDGGQTWSSPFNHPHMSPSFGSADPSMGFDSNGNLYLCYIDFSKAVDSGAIYVSKSTDGGLNWNAPVKAIDFYDDGLQFPIDRPWMAIDKSGGSHDGNIYVTSMSPLTFGPIPPPYHAYFTRSTDGGNSFRPLRTLDTTNFLVGDLIQGAMPSPVVGSDGRFHAVYPSYVPTQKPWPTGILATSTDGGNTLTHQFGFIPSPGFTDTSAKRAALLRIDPSDPDHLVSVYLATTHGDADVFIRETYNSGLTWSSEIRVNDDPIGNDRMQDMVWASFDDDGDFVVSWRDRRNGSDSTYQTGAEHWAAYRHRDSSSFSPNFKMSSQLVAYDPILEEAGNDFMGVDLSEDTISAVWGDPRNGNLTIWFYRAAIGSGTVSARPIVTESQPGLQVFPNPAVDFVTIVAQDILKIKVMDLSGRLLFEESPRLKGDRAQISLEALPVGQYQLIVETEAGTDSKIVRKE